MTPVRAACVVAIFALAAASASAQSITLFERDAVVWLPEQTVHGAVSGAGELEGTLYVDDDEYTFIAEGEGFEVDVTLEEGTHAVVACAGDVCSDTVTWTLGYPLRPEVYAYAQTSGRDVDLHAAIMERPNGPIATYAWSADVDNPASIVLSAASDSVGRVTIPDGAPDGEYYFDLLVTDVAGRQGAARTFVTLDEEGVSAFDIDEDHAAWIDRAIIYEVTPYIFEANGTWSDVTARLHEIDRLGVNTLWIQPVFEAQLEGPSTSGQGYGITNYFDLRTDLGTEEDLRELVRTAREEFGMRVLFDFVPGHTSIEHPYAQDVLEHGAASHYFDFYLTETDGARYSSEYNRSAQGPFYYYFWDRLVIIDWSHAEAYRWMMEAGRAWIEDYDVDGYRIDAVWGVDARTPEAMQKWRFDLKRIKPEIMLLGERAAAEDMAFENRFDVAFDWFDAYDEDGWVSHWTWQRQYSEAASLTVFNAPETSRANLLRAAVTNRGLGFHPDANILRFMENNDTERFLAWHDVEQTKMAATLLFSLPGVPMLYNGQEIGASEHPYETSAIFAQGRSIRSLDRYGLHDHYQSLAALRSALPALSSDSFSEIQVSPEVSRERIFAYRRSHEGVHVLGIVNMADETLTAELRLPLARMGIEPADVYFVTDLTRGDVTTASGSDLDTVVRDVPGFTTELVAISGEELMLPVAADEPTELPGSLSLQQNFPNPFRAWTTVTFTLPRLERVSLRIYDVLGREVTTLLDTIVEAGRHHVQFDGGHLASGIFFYRLTAGDRSESRRMILAR